MLYDRNSLIVFIILVLVVFSCLIKADSLHRNRRPPIIDKKFYRVEEVEPYLNKIHNNVEEIYRETDIVKDKVWTSWPEKYLYDAEGDWNIFPFYAFGIWVNDNCNQCPHIYNFIKNIPGLKLATLSRMTPGMKLTPHEGWASHSNHVIRCHFGLMVPEGCYISVKEISGDDEEEYRFHRKGEWLCFDDSKTHYAHNSSRFDRIVLIVDVERPKHIATGKSQVGDTKELKKIVDYFRSQNIKMEDNETIDMISNGEE